MTFNEFVEIVNSRRSTILDEFAAAETKKSAALEELRTVTTAVRYAMQAKGEDTSVKTKPTATT